MGVIISQVMRLMRSSDPDPVLGFFVISIPLAAICHVMALIVCLLGLYRFLHWQNKMARDYAISSGWELTTIFALSALVSCSTPHSRKLSRTNTADLGMHFRACTYHHS